MLIKCYFISNQILSSVEMNFSLASSQSWILFFTIKEAHCCPFFFHAIQRFCKQLERLAKVNWSQICEKFKGIKIKRKMSFAMHILMSFEAGALCTVFLYVDTIQWMGEQQKILYVSYLWEALYSRVEIYASES